MSHLQASAIQAVKWQLFFLLVSYIRLIDSPVTHASCEKLSFQGIIHQELLIVHVECIQFLLFTQFQRTWLPANSAIHGKESMQKEAHCNECRPNSLFCEEIFRFPFQQQQKLSFVQAHFIFHKNFCNLERICYV